MNESLLINFGKHYDFLVELYGGRLNSIGKKVSFLAEINTFSSNDIITLKGYAIKDDSIIKFKYWNSNLFTKSFKSLKTDFKLLVTDKNVINSILSLNDKSFKDFYVTLKFGMKLFDNLPKIVQNIELMSKAEKELLYGSFDILKYMMLLNQMVRKELDFQKKLNKLMSKYGQIVNLCMKLSDGGIDSQNFWNLVFRNEFLKERNLCWSFLIAVLLISFLGSLYEQSNKLNIIESNMNVVLKKDLKLELFSKVS